MGQTGVTLRNQTVVSGGQSRGDGDSAPGHRQDHPDLVLLSDLKKEFNQKAK